MGKITIIGAGNGGCTYAAYLGKRGHEVCLYEVPELADNLKDVIELGGFEMRGCDTGFGPVAKCTTDIQEAVTGDSQGKLENFYLGQAATGQHETPADLARAIQDMTAERICRAPI